MPLRILRACALVLAAAAVGALALILLNAAEVGTLSLHRWREPFLALVAAAMVWVLAHRRPGAAARALVEAARRVLAHPSSFRVISASAAVLFVAVAVTHHLAYRTSSHDLGIYQQALANAFTSPPLDAPLLGRSLLAEHLSPVLFLIAPLARLWPGPLLLVMLHALALWATLPVLGRAARTLGLSNATVNLVALVYLFHPVTVHTLEYPFHPEALYPVLFLGLYAASLEGRPWLFAALAALTLAVKEDAGLYLAGMGAFLALDRRRRTWGLATALIGTAWTVLAVAWLLPALGAPGGSYPFLERWASWPEAVQQGAGPLLERVVTIASPELVVALLATGLLPLLTRRGRLLVAAPLLVNVTSDLPIQAHLGLYYGAAFLGLAAVAALDALHRLGPVLARHRSLATWAVVAVLVLVGGRVTFPDVPPCRPQVDAALAALPEGAEVAAMPCLVPRLVAHTRVHALWPDRPVEGKYAALRTTTATWPFSEDQAAALAERLASDPSWTEILACHDFVLLEHEEVGPPGAAPS